MNQSQEGQTVSNFESRIREFPRVALFSAPTQIERLSRIEEALGAELRGVRLYVCPSSEHLAQLAA